MSALVIDLVIDLARDLARDLAIDAAIVNSIDGERLERFRVSLTAHRLRGSVCEERYSVTMKKIEERLASLKPSQPCSIADGST